MILPGILVIFARFLFFCVCDNCSHGKGPLRIDRFDNIMGFMKNMEKQTDRRKNPRFKAINDLAAIIQNDRSKIGTITGISRGGLAFRYIEFDKHEIDLKEQVKLAIICSSDNFHWHDVPCEIIMDGHSPPEYPFSLLPMRKCHVQFDEMMSDQISQMEDFIAKYTYISD